jgi:hypothetical protein
MIAIVCFLHLNAIMVFTMSEYGIVAPADVLAKKGKRIPNQYQQGERRVHAKKNQ